MNRLRLILLLLVLVGLLAYAWVRNQSTPAEPSGTFWGVLNGVVLMLTLVGGPLAFWWLRKPRSR